MSPAQYLFRLPARLFGDEQVPSALPLIPAALAEAIERRLGLLFTAERPKVNLCLAQSEEIRDDFRTTFHAQDLLQSLYALLNTQSPQAAAPEQLHLPVPSDPDIFWRLVQLGGQLVSLHTLNFIIPEQQKCAFTKELGTSEMKIESVEFHPNSATPAQGSIWINASQHFDHVPQRAWEYHINAVPPARQWLWMHQGKSIGPSQIQQYQKILFALTETVPIRKAVAQLEIKNTKLPIF